MHTDWPAIAEDAPLPSHLDGTELRGDKGGLTTCHGAGTIVCEMRGTILSLEEVLKTARTRGIKCTRRTFWRYWKQGLLHQGEKIPGRGNVLYFPEDVVEELSIIQWWKLIGFSFRRLDYRFVSGLKGALKSYGGQLPPLSSIGGTPLLRAISASVTVLGEVQSETISAYREGLIDHREAEQIIKNTVGALKQAKKASEVLAKTVVSKPREKLGQNLTFRLIGEVFRIVETAISGPLEEMRSPSRRGGKRRHRRSRKRLKVAKHE